MADFFPPAPPTTNDSVPVPPPVAAPDPNLPPEQNPAPDNFAPIAPKDQNPNQKKLLIIIGAVVGVIILIAIIAWLLYQNLVWNKDEKILTDAWHKMFTFETLMVEGELKGETKEMGGNPEEAVTFSSNFSSTISGDGQAMQATFNALPPGGIDAEPIVFQGEIRRFVGDDVFFQISGLEKILGAAVTSSFENTWIHLNAKEQISQLSSEEMSGLVTKPEELQNCIKQKTQQLRTNEQMRTELVQVLNKSMLFTATRLKDTQKHEGKTAYLYDISVEPKNAHALAQALMQTQIYAQIKECDQKIFTEVDEALNAEELTPQMMELAISTIRPFLPKTTLWISQATHEPMRVEFDFNYNISVSIHIDAFANFHFDQRVALTKPTDFREYDEIMAEYELAQRMRGETRRYIDDTNSLRIAYKTARAVEAYKQRYGVFPWGGDVTTPFYQDFRKLSRYDDDNWLDAIEDDIFGLTSSESIGLQYGSYHLFKPQGRADTTHIYVCFGPTSISFQEEAAKRCIDSTMSYKDFVPCETTDGTIPTGDGGDGQFSTMIIENGIYNGWGGNLICVSNDGTTLNVPVTSKLQQYDPEQYQQLLSDIQLLNS